MLKNKYFRIGVSLVVALLITFIIYQSTEGSSEIEYQKVVTAKKDILQNEKVDSENLEIEKVPARNIPENTLKNFPKGKIAAVDIFTGQYIIPQILSEKRTVEIKPRHRVYPVPVTLEKAGWINKGDMVDVLWAPKKERNKKNNDIKSEIIVSGVVVDKILNSSGKRIIQKPGVDKIDKEINPKVAELLVSVDQAKRLSGAVNSGVLSLARYKPESEPVEKDGDDSVEDKLPSQKE
ncbi:MAG: hypothetical protein K9L17_08300 [Clostridiales bacterium]|nr:hypothetical protein [Clostridiales bacterium]MCF8022676.1 hypothetical protein [Clostridiales bacterium]